MIDTAFERLDMPAGDSDSETEQSYVTEPLLEAKDPYLPRALPYMIGSQAFMQDDDVGLVDMSSGFIQVYAVFSVGFTYSGATVNSHDL